MPRPGDAAAPSRLAFEAHWPPRQFQPQRRDAGSQMIAPRQANIAGMVVVAVLMILFGVAEVGTAFTHNFLGTTTSTANVFTYAAAIIGASYAAAGVLALARRKRAAAIAISLLGADIAGRVGLVVTGLYPLDSAQNILSMLGGTIIVAAFAIYITLNWGSFD